MNKRRDNNQMRSHLLILVMHVIKIHAEKRKTGSWQNSIRYSLKGINKLNNRGVDFDIELEEVFEDALEYASLEINGGCNKKVVLSLIDKDLVLLSCKLLIDL